MARTASVPESITPNDSPMQPTSSSMPKASDAYATEGDLSGPQTDESSSGQGSSAKGNEPVRDVIEAEPGIIETTELAPIGDKIAPDRGSPNDRGRTGPLIRALQQLSSAKRPLLERRSTIRSLASLSSDTSRCITNYTIDRCALESGNVAKLRCSEGPSSCTRCGA